MGREIRRVQAGWEHPKDERGRYRPLYDCAYATEAQEWLDNANAWARGEHEDQKKGYGKTCRFYWEYAGTPPNEDYYRPAWTDEERTHVQMYETVSEGTPVSPVFASREALADWLVTQGHSRDAADAFAKGGWAPSFFIAGGKLAANVDALPLMRGTDAAD